MRELFILKNGTSLLVREATLQDALPLNDLVARIFGSSDQVLTSLEEFEASGTLQAQLKRIQHFSEAIGKCIFVAEIDRQLVGTIDFWNGYRKRIEHTGEFGMGVLAEYRDQGIGACLIQVLLKWASANPVIEKVKLGVFATNLRAIHLYEKMGFEEEGRRVAEIKMADGQYHDVIEMYKNVK
ncbi:MULTISPECIES: GNAT family N-acetyltransferase [unclassified Aureispira]|uniref:GNAT family N-acetyltransferase n=1 Tax=unclassified Aureispira TaxID=2649989 RepID=UPI0006964EA3|nr:MULTISPECIES: GNAT family protein [unclassified Aureispira]WMX15341.1 GNAT family protein [Aureispira sp. CCB-E]